MIEREQIVTVDVAHRRVAYAVIEGAFSHHSASMQVESVSDGCRMIWVSDFLPNDAAAVVALNRLPKLRINVLHGGCLYLEETSRFFRLEQVGFPTSCAPSTNRSMVASLQDVPLTGAASFMAGEMGRCESGN
jgi:hypothetical protein